MSHQEKKDNGKGHHGNSHSGGDHHAHMITDLRKRFWISLEAAGTILMFLSTVIVAVNAKFLKIPDNG